MTKPSCFRKPGSAIFAAGLLLLSPSIPTLAQPPPSQKAIDEIEKQIESLQKSVQELRGTPVVATNAAATSTVNTNDPIAMIRDEGMNRSQVMETLSYLTDVIGPRLTGSPNMKRANEWTRDKLESWGLTNAHLEAWGPFGKGWSLKRFSAQVIEPQNIPLMGFPNAWTPGFERPFEAKVVYFDARTEADLDKFKGKLKGAIILASPIREVRAHWDAQASRLTETNLLTMANAEAQAGNSGQFTPNVNPDAGPGRGGARGAAVTTIAGGAGGRRGGPPGAIGTNAPGGRIGGRRGGGGGFGGARFTSFLAKEGAALIINPSSMGDGGTFYVMSASVPPPDTQSSATNSSTAGTNSTQRFVAPVRYSPYSTNAPAFPAQITLAVEQYNRLVRMCEAGESLKMAVDLQVKFHYDDLMSYNTIAEIPGTDLKKEIVMLGGHMDSWQSGTGATDNGAGVAAAMEAVRIIKALGLKPRRTIRVALWSGEEQGLLGSAAYVKEHFGYYPPSTNGFGRGFGGGGGGGRSGAKLVKGKDYDKLSAYYNLDNGAGKIRGIYLQGNESVRSTFRRWLTPFRDLEASTVTSGNTGSTDHISFDQIGLPGFQFIQDPLEYGTRTHHSNEDVFDRVLPDDMKQASIIFAAFAYNTAMMEEKLPRKSND